MKVFNTVADLQAVRLTANNQLVAVKGVGNYTMQAAGTGLTVRLLCLVTQA